MDENVVNIDETDAKVRLFLELSHPHPIQILSYTPLTSFEKWNPAIMYNKPNNPFYYAFINDKDLIDKVKETIIHKKGNLLEELDYIKEDLEKVEFNGYSIEEYQENENLINKANTTSINNNNPQNSENIAENNNDNNIESKDLNTIINNINEDKYVIFCRFNLKDFGFIHDYNKIQKEDLNKINNMPIIYALKGRIQALLNYRLKELETKKEEITTFHSRINIVNVNDEDKPSQSGLNDIQTLGHKKEDEKNKSIKANIGIDGHWFLIRDFTYIEFLSFIKYKEIYNNNEIQKKLNEDLNNASPINKNSTFNLTSNITNLNINKPKDKYTQEHQFAFFINESNKFVTVYQNKSCKNHHIKNEFICKTCGAFCCLECFENNTQKNIHSGHKIVLLDEESNKFEEDSRNLDERIQYLKSIIENEIIEKKNEIALIKNKNAQVVNQINEENEKIRMEIKKEEINRAKVLGFLGNEALRIINDYDLKMKYLTSLYENGDMNNYLANYFYFEKFFKKEIMKNLEVLQRKISLCEEKFITNNEKLNNIIKDLERLLK